RPVAPYDEAGFRTPFPDQARCAEEVRHSFFGPEIGECADGDPVRAGAAGGTWPEPRYVHAVRDDHCPSQIGGPIQLQPFRDRLGVDEDVARMPQHVTVYPLFERSPQVAQVPLARDHDRHTRDSRGGYSHEIAVEVEAVDELHAMSAHVAGECPYHHCDAGRLGRSPSPAPPDDPPRLELRPRRAPPPHAPDI